MKIAIALSIATAIVTARKTVIILNTVNVAPASAVSANVIVRIGS